MSKTTLKPRKLPLNLPKPAAHPSGELMDTSKPYTLPLNKEISLSRCIGPYTEVDRKLWATLVAHAWDDLDKTSVHEVQAQDIARLFRELKGGENGSAWIMASARRLRMSGLDWQDHEEEGTVALLSGLKINKVTGTIYYQFSDFLIERLLDNKRFSRLRLHFMIGLSGKYSVSLYMLLEGAANLRRPIIELTVDELRDRLSVPNGKLEKWFDLNRFAIDPALNQINDNPIAAGFSVACEPILKGRKVERVRFTVTKSAQRLTDETALKPKTPRPRKTPNDSGAFVLPTSAYEQAKKAAPGLDVYYLETEWRDWIAKKPQATNLAGAFVEFCRGKYQGNKGAGGLSRGMP